MALINCPECGAQVSSAAPSCPHCGSPLNVAPAAPAPAPAPAPVQPVYVQAPASDIEQKVANYIQLNSGKFPPECIPALREKLLAQSPSKIDMLCAVSLMDPIINLIVSFFFGVYGVDRFLAGQIGMGVLKLITGGGCFVWAVVDLFLVMGYTRQSNYEKVLKLL